MSTIAGNVLSDIRHNILLLRSICIASTIILSVRDNVGTFMDYKPIEKWTDNNNKIKLLFSADMKKWDLKVSIVFLQLDE